MARLIYGWLLLLLLYFYFTNNLVHQWEQPVLIYPEADNTYWFLHMLNIPQAIMQNRIGSFVFDILLLASVFLFIIFPDYIIFSVISVICFWLFQIMYGSSTGHHYHHAGFLIVPIAFIFRNQLKFYFTWELVRYWILFLLVCSGVYKFYYGGFFQQTNMSLILRQHFVPSDTWRSQTVLYLIEHPKVSQLLYQFAAILQLSCIIGFFTHKFDWLLLLAILVFNLSNIYIMNIPFWDNSLMLAPFIPWGNIDTWLRRTRFLKPEAI
jgi:hypothetical protein